MSETRSPGTGTGQVPEQTRGAAPPSYRAEPEPTAWTGWILFASMLMIMVGAFQAIVGFVALFKDSYYVVRSTGLVVQVDYTAWGWVHLALGVVALAAGFGLMAGQMWARVVGIAMALVSAIVNFAFIAAYPLWSILVIALDVVVIWAIGAHGREMKSARY
jgi:hypothetical protein